MKIEWNKISSGEEFESLCSAVLSFEHPQVKLYRRPGRDGCIDAMSNDKKTVYQFKYRSSGSILDVANREFNKIKSIKEDKKHKYHKPWSKVNKWVLMTNLSKNPSDETKWKEKIESKFEDIDIDVELWSGEDLEKLIRKHSPIQSEFFGDSGRLYLSITEAKQYLENKSILKSEYETTYYDRETDLKEATKFIKSSKEKILLVTGEGGVGKTRFLLEIGNILESSNTAKPTVYWANVDTLSHNKNFPGIATDKDHVILIDEPDSVGFLKMLIEQLTIPNSKIKEWKIIISSRRYNKKIIDVLKEPRTKKIVKERKLETMKKDKFNKLLDEQLASIKHRDVEQLKRYLHERVKGYPIWINVAVAILEKGGSIGELPEDEHGFVKKYIDQILDSIPKDIATPETARHILKWLCLYSKIRPTNSDLIEFIKNKTGCHRISDFIHHLEHKLEHKSGLLKRFGGMLKIKPGIIRESLLLSSLVNMEDCSLTDFGREVSDMLKDLVSNNSIVPDLDDIVESLAYVDLYIHHTKNKESIILKPFMNQLIDLAKGAKNAKEQLDVVSIAKHCAHSCPEEIIDIVDAILEKETKSIKLDIYITTEEVTHSKVVGRLTGLLLSASRYTSDDDIRKEIADRVVKLLKRETTNISEEDLIYNFDIPSAKSLIETMCNDAEGILRSYRAEFSDEALKYLDKLQSQEANKLDEQELSLESFYRDLITPLVSLEVARFIMYKYEFSMERYVLIHEQEEYKYREKIIQKLWDTLSNDTHWKHRKIIFRLLNEVFRDLHNVIKHYRHEDINQSKNTLQKYKEEEKQLLKMLMEKIKSEWIEQTDLKEAKTIWGWYYKYSKNKELKDIAKKCENISKKGKNLFDEILSYYKPEDKPKASKLVKDHFEPFLEEKDASAIEKSIVEGMKIVDQDMFSYVADDLYDYFFVPNYDNPVIQEFIDNTLFVEDERLRGFSMNLIAFKLCELRKNGDPKKVLALLDDVIKCYDKRDSKLIEFIACVYQVHKTMLVKTSVKEFNYLLKKQKLFENQKKDVCFAYLLTRLYLSLESDPFKKYAKVMEGIINKCDGDDKTNVVSYVISRLLVNDTLPRSILEWLLEMIFEASAHSTIGIPIVFTHYKMLLDRLEDDKKCFPTIFNFKDILFERIEKYEKGDKDKFKIMPIGNEIFKIFEIPPYNDISDDSVKECFKELLTLNDNKYPVGYYLPRWLQNFDPSGEYITPLVINKIESLQGDESVDNIVQWSRYAGICAEGSEEWRNIADTVYQKFNDHLTGEDKTRALWSLDAVVKYEFQMGMGTYGEFSPQWQQDVNNMKDKWEKENHEFIKEFFKLKLEEAESILANKKQYHEEEHGDR